MQKRISPKLVLGSLTIALVLLINPSSAFAGAITIPTCDAAPGSPEVHLITGIGGLTTLTPTINDAVDPIEITLEETWTSTARSYIIICGLASDETYKVIKIIHNESGVDWDNFENELLDLSVYVSPADDPINGVHLHVNDALFDPDQLTYPTYVTNLYPGGPPFFSLSNNLDEVDFAMDEIGFPRTSTIWDQHNEDEDDTIDFLRFFDGILVDTGTDTTMTFGLQAFDPVEQPIVLTQVPNFIRDPVGGEFLDIDTTAVLLAGAQMNATWLIPLVLGMLAFGIIVARKLRF